MLWCAPDRYGTIDTQRGEHALLQVRPRVFALARRNRTGPLGLLLIRRRQIIAIDAHRGRIAVHLALVEVQGLLGPYGTGRAPLHRARGLEPR